MFPFPDPEQYGSNRATVDAGLWPKLRRLAGRLPFSEDLLAAYYAAVDSHTPFQVRAMLYAALAYFVIPTDLVPDMLVGLGFTDDAAVLAAALKTLADHIRPEHREQARSRLADVERGTA